MKDKEFKEPLQDIFDAEGIGYSETSSGELIIDRCYNCGRSKKLYVHADTGVFICFRCDERGGPVKLVSKILGCNYAKAHFILFGKKGPEFLHSDDSSDLEVRITGIKRQRAQSKAELPKPVPRPYYMKPLTRDDVDAWNYLRKRGLTDEVIEELNLLHWESSKRIVLPVTVDGEMYGTLARDYIGDQERKVLNSTGNWRSFTVWNYDNARDSDELVLCEGAFSAIKCGIYRSVALLGKTATAGQIEVIRSTNAKKIYICLDIGTEDDQYKLYSQLNLYYPGQIYQIKLPPIKIVKCPKCKKETELDDRDEHTKFECQHCQYKTPSQFDFRQLVKKAEYKDAGDYSFEEMEEFIQQARPFQGGPTSW